MSSCLPTAGNTDFRFIDRPRDKHKLGLPPNRPAQRGPRIPAGPMFIRSHLRPGGHRLAGARLATALTLATMTLATVTLAALAARAEEIVLRVGDQKGGNRSLLEIAGYAKDVPYRIAWSEFPAAAPILEALNAGALDVGYTGDLSFLTVVAAGAPIKAIGGTKSDPRTQTILVRAD